MDCNRQASPNIGLSERQIRFFRDTGFLRLPTAFGAEELARVVPLVRSELAAGKPPVRTAPDGRVFRLSRVYERGGVFRELLTSPLVLGPLRSLLGPNIELVLNRHNHLTVSGARTSSVRLHRDVLQWSRPIVTVIVYLEKSDVSSGYTHIIPASHLLPFVGTPNNGGTWMDEHHVFADLISQALPVPMEAGGILALDGLAFHAAGRETGKTRLAVSGAFHSVDELKAISDPDVSVLVAGERLYRGGIS